MQNLCQTAPYFKALLFILKQYLWNLITKKKLKLLWTLICDQIYIIIYTIIKNPGPNYIYFICNQFFFYLFFFYNEHDFFSLKLAGKYNLFYSNLYSPNICFGLGHCKNGLVLEKPLLVGRGVAKFSIVSKRT